MVFLRSFRNVLYLLFVFAKLLVNLLQQKRSIVPVKTQRKTQQILGKTYTNKPWQQVVSLKVIATFEVIVGISNSVATFLSHPIAIVCTIDIIRCWRDIFGKISYIYTYMRIKSKISWIVSYYSATMTTLASSMML